MRIATKLMTPTVLASAMLLSACTTEKVPTATPNPNGNNSGNNGIIAGTLEARAARPTLTLRNTTEFMVGYMVVDKDQATIALYPPCGQNCPTLKQGESVGVSYTAISGYTATSREARVMWWKYIRRADGSMAPDGGVQTTIVRLD
ncbi:MAG TPA: hypothetical protein VE869_16480 [Gemmatimonas sp.]|nr:hypothetical protein [Gemmatimonas sp.]